MKKAQITVDEIRDSFKKDVKQVQLRQVITHEYDAVKTFNSHADSLFTAEEMGLEAKTYEENRVTWRDVPKDATIEMVQAQLAKFPNACIYKVLSNDPILTDDQERVYKNGLSGEAFDEFVKTNELESQEWDSACKAAFIENIKERQLVRYGENNAEGKPADEPVLDKNGRIQYRALFFSQTDREDIDARIPELIATESVVLAENTATVASQVEQ